MSSGTAPNCGHMLEVTATNIVKLGIDLSGYVEIYNDWLTGEPRASLAEFLVFLFIAYEVRVLQAKIRGTTREIYLYCHHNGDIYDDLEEDVLYFVFSSHDIFTMEKTSFGKFLEEEGISPKWSLWTNFG